MIQFNSNLLGVKALSLMLLLFLGTCFGCFSQEKDVSDIMEKAEQNIEKHRKGRADITFVDKDGTPLSGVKVTVKQTSHDFLFGNIIFPVVGVLGKFEDIDVYRPELFKKRFKDVFNMAVFPFYWASYEKDAGRVKWDRIKPILQWCERNGITAKSHTLA